MTMNHLAIYNKNIDEVYHLLDIHKVLVNRKGFRRRLEVLNKSEIVLLIACWEAFIEDMALNAFDFLLSNAIDHNVFPAKVLTQASKEFWDVKDERGVWALAGDGWKAVLTSRRERILKDHLEGFHSPRGAQIDKLFASLIGFNSLSSNWKWKNMSVNKAKGKLEELINLRGAIAHRVSASKSVTKKYCLDSGVFISRLGVVSSNAIRDFVYTRVGLYPWGDAELKL